MAKLDLMPEEGKERYDLTIHFGTEADQHKIRAQSLAIFIQSYQKIWKELTGSNIEIEIGIPEEGSWETILYFIAPIGVILHFIGIKNFSLLCTGKTDAQIFQAVNEYIVQFFTTPAADEKFKELSSKCIEEKNKIYEQFSKDPCIKSFDLNGLPPIEKMDFAFYIEELPDKDYQYLGVAKITVSSPVWEGSRSWRGKIDDIDGEKSFDFDKNLTKKFWDKVASRHLPVTTHDRMKVQLVCSLNTKKYRVIRVIEYNECEIDAPLTEEEIAKIASVRDQNIPKKKDAPSKERAQPDLFDAID